MARVIQREIVNALAKDILSGKYVAGDAIYVSTDAKGFVFGSQPVHNDEQPDISTSKNQKKSPDNAKVNDLLQSADDKDA
ncbi:MAG TPA: hypothetical protein PK611_04810, partial [Saprospiraceae bacterium]|nr:hypothetical protein [Saprospiraceae bacterium]